MFVVLRVFEVDLLMELQKSKGESNLVVAVAFIMMVLIVLNLTIPAL